MSKDEGEAHEGYQEHPIVDEPEDRTSSKRTFNIHESGGRKKTVSTCISNTLSDVPIDIG